MRKTLLLLALASVAGAQGRVYPERRAFLVLGDAVGTAAGGFLTGTTFLQAMRVSGVVSVGDRHAVDFTAVRLQTFIPPGGRVNDLEYANPEGDALILSYAQLNRTRARGIPNELALGFGAIRRNTAEAGRTRDTWVARAGYDADPFARWSHFDSTIGLHVYFLPANGSNLVYIVTIGLAARIG
jgi:hypothetical protein